MNKLERAAVLGLTAAALTIGATLSAGAGVDTSNPAPNAVVRQAPKCWEDEVIVQVVYDPYGDLEGTLGCVPADNLPVTGFRP